MNQAKPRPWSICISKYEIDLVRILILSAGARPGAGRTGPRGGQRGGAAVRAGRQLAGEPGLPTIPGALAEAQLLCGRFACHGSQDLADPTRAALELADGPLSVPLQAAPGQFLRPVTATATPTPIIASPPAPPTSANRRGERANHARTALAAHAQALSQTTPIETETRPRTSI